MSASGSSKGHRIPAPERAPEVGTLRQIDSWQASFAAAAVLDRSGTLATHGDLDARVQIASVTKLLSAIAVLVAVEEGTVGLEDPVGQPGCTLRHLLCHAGGYGFDTPAVIAEPATRRIYSNTGYELLARHLEERSGLAFGRYLAEAVLEPLGMGASVLRGSPAKDLWSSVADLVTFAAELLTPRLLAPSTMQRFCTPELPDLAGVLPGWGRQEPCPWGLGAEVKGAKDPHWTGATAEPGTFGHFGGSGTFLWVDPGRGLACVVLTDRAFGEWAVRAWPGFSDAVRADFGRTD